MGCWPPWVIYSDVYHETVSQNVGKYAILEWYGKYWTKENYFFSEFQSTLINKHCV